MLRASTEKKIHHLAVGAWLLFKQMYLRSKILGICSDLCQSILFKIRFNDPGKWSIECLVCNANIQICQKSDSLLILLEVVL